MKKIILSVIFVATLLVSLISCDKDINDNPNASVLGTTKLLSPTNGATIILNPNTFRAVAMTVKWTSADFGYSASVKYVLEIVKATDNFVSPQVIPLATYNENTNSTYESAITTTILNGKLKAIGATLGTSTSFKMRVYAQPSGQLDTSENGLRAYSQEVTFTCNVYDPIDETPKLYVMGNFGAASTFADWDINLTGTSNSPLIYSPLKDGVYEGFVYMNVAAPQFKFANPTATDLDIKGLKTQYTQTAISGVSLISTNYFPLGNNNNAGEILSTTDISTGNVITPVSSSTGIGTYFIKTDWTNNKYIIVKRRIGIGKSNTPIRYFTFDSNPASPYYRLYTLSTTLNAGDHWIELRPPTAIVASGAADKLERMGIDSNSSDLVVTPNASSNIKNKLKFTGASNFKVLVPGSYTVVLDLNNSANYNLRIIPN